MATVKPEVTKIQLDERLGRKASALQPGLS